MLTYCNAQYQCNTLHNLHEPLLSLALYTHFFIKVFIACGAFYLVMPRRQTSDPQLSHSLADWTMLITLSAAHVSAIFPFKGKFNTASLIASPCLYIVMHYMFKHSFSHIS